MPYAQQWMNQIHEDANILLVTSNLDVSTDINTWWEAYYNLQSAAKFSFHADMVTWWNPSPIFQQEEIGTVYAGIIEPQNPVEMITGSDSSQVFHWRNYTISNIGLDQFYFYKEINRDKQRHKILERLAVIAQREDNWDGYDSKKPNEITINRAKHFIKELLNNDVISARLPQLAPFICSDEDGYITVECYNGKRSLCFDIQEDETKYTKIWRKSANTMTQTDSLNKDNYLPLWEWFFDE